MPAVNLLTVRRMAELLQSTPSRVEHIVRSRRIEPVAVAGNTRLFDRAALARVRYETNLLAARRDAKEASR